MQWLSSYKSLFLHDTVERNLLSALVCPFPSKLISLKVLSFPKIPLATSLWKQYWFSDKTNPVTWLWWSHFTKESGKINVSSVQTSEHLTVLKSWNANKDHIFQGKEWVKEACITQNKVDRYFIYSKDRELSKQWTKVFKCPQTSLCWQACIQWDSRYFKKWWEARYSVFFVVDCFFPFIFLFSIKVWQIIYFQGIFTRCEVSSS